MTTAGLIVHSAFRNRRRLTLSADGGAAGLLVPMIFHAARDGLTAAESGKRSGSRLLAEDRGELCG